MFILAQQRDVDVKQAFAQYRDYLEVNRSRFPPGALRLATSDWYFGFASHEAPHDSRLESVRVIEDRGHEVPAMRVVSIEVNLLGAYHDGYIQLRYPKVYSYTMEGAHLSQGHGDWRYDEFRLDEQGRLIHEIEWPTYGATSTWIVVASDIEHRWIAL